MASVFGGASLAVKSARASKRKKDDLANVDYKDFSGCLMVFYEAVKKLSKLEKNDKRFRVTLHRVDTESHTQMVPYVGWSSDDKDKKPGPDRTWSNHCGLVGKIARLKSKDPLFTQIDDSAINASEGGFEEILTAQHSYTKEQSRRMAKGRLAAVAVPIFDGNDTDVIAVIYCDSSDRDFFTPAILELAVASGIAIAAYIKIKFHAEKN